MLDGRRGRRLRHRWRLRVRVPGPLTCASGEAIAPRVSLLRDLRPAEYPLAEPCRIKIIEATADTKLDSYAGEVPREKYQKEELRLLNGIDPNGKLVAGDLIKVVE